MITRFMCILSAGKFFITIKYFLHNLFLLYIYIYIFIQQIIFAKGASVINWFAIFISVPVITSLWDAILPLGNGNQRRTFPIHVDYIIFDHVNYFYAVSIHYAAVYFSITCIYITGETYFIIGVEYVCGLLAITR